MKTANRAHCRFLGLALVACFTITDPNERARCRALERKSSGDCSTITDYNARAACRGEVQKRPSACDSIWNAWEREKCKRGSRP